MSDRDPALPTPELLEISGRLPRPDAGSPRRRIAWLAAAAVGAAAAGAGLWAWQAWTEQGPQPAEALPGNTLAYVALDLDPPGGQKVEALGALRKFPSLEDQLGLGSVDEVRRSVVEELASEGNCELNYGDDVEPWIGDRIAFAVVAQEQPEPVVVLQVKDADQANAGLEAVSRACDGIGFGYAVDGDWAVLARNAAVAKQVHEAAEGETLDEDPEFQELTGAAGDSGLATIYAAPEAGPALLAEIEKNPFLGWTAVQLFNSAFDPVSTLFTGMGFLAVGEPSFDEGTAVAVPERSETIRPELLEAEAELMKEFEHLDELSKKEQKRLFLQQVELYEEMYGAEQDGGPRYAEARPRAPFGQVASVEDDFDEPEVPAALRETLQSFSGLGGVARFEDGGFEVEVVGDILEGTFGGMYAGSAGDDIVSELPDDTAIAYGVGFSEGWVDILITQLSQQFPWSVQTEAETIAALEKATGLDVPGDLETLGGEGLSLVAGSGIDPDQAFEDPTKAPVAVRISGDPAAIETALEKLRTSMGPEAGPMLVSRRVGEDVVVGANAAYLDHLASGDGLGDSGRFTQVVSNADDATTVLFVDFDAGDWIAKLAESEGDREDAEPLDALGMTVTKDEDQQRMLLRLTFD